MCSEHYANYLAHDSSPEATRFIINEKNRQKSIQDKLGVDDELVTFHFDLLRFADTLSLFLCLNKPGAGKEELHYFFRNEIPLPERLQKQFGESLHLEWSDKQTIDSDKSSFTLSIPFKKVLKAAIAKQGIRKSYKEASEESLEVKIEGDRDGHLMW